MNSNSKQKAHSCLPLFPFFFLSFSFLFLSFLFPFLFLFLSFLFPFLFLLHPFHLRWGSLAYAHMWPVGSTFCSPGFPVISKWPCVFMASLFFPIFTRDLLAIFMFSICVNSDLFVTCSQGVIGNCVRDCSVIYAPQERRLCVDLLAFYYYLLQNE